MSSTSYEGDARSVAAYLREIRRIPLLSPEEERALAQEHRRGENPQAVTRLVLANLRYVVNQARQYAGRGFPLSDLIQEGNIGLLKAIQGFDPDRGVRLVVYARWWIRAHLQAYVLGSWSLVRLGTTQAERTIFFSLRRVIREIEKARLRRGVDSGPARPDQVAARMRVKASEVEETAARMGQRDLSLDAPVREGSDDAHVDLLAAGETSHEAALAEAQLASMARRRVQLALEALDRRERYVIEARVMSDAPASLQEVGAHFGCSGQRAGQIEIRARKKLTRLLTAVNEEGDPARRGSGEDAPEVRTG